MTVRQIVTAVAACLAALTARGQQEQFAAQLKAASAKTETIECDFTLTRTMSFAAAPAVSRGRFGYLRGEGIALDFSQPAGESIVMGRERFAITAAGRRSVVKIDSNPALRHLRQMLTACMTGDVEILGRGARLAFTEDDRTITATVTPTDRRTLGMLRLITLTFDKADMSLSALKMDEASGDVSEYKFFNKQFNTRIDPARFEVR